MKEIAKYGSPGCCTTLGVDKAPRGWLFIVTASESAGGNKTVAALLDQKEILDLIGVLSAHLHEEECAA